MIRIEDNIAEKAKELGLNISKVSENALKELIRRIERPDVQKEVKYCSDDSHNDNWWGRPDLNRSPESPSLRAWTKLADGPSLQ